MSLQGRCEHCRVRWVWDGRPRLKDAWCPKCGRRLLRTSHQYSGATRHARGEGSPRQLRALTFHDLLVTNPAAAFDDVTRRRVEHRDRMHRGGGSDPTCPVCRVLDLETENARRKLTPAELASAPGPEVRP